MVCFIPEEVSGWVLVKPIPDVLDPSRLFRFILSRSERGGMSFEARFQAIYRHGRYSTVYIMPTL